MSEITINAEKISLSKFKSVIQKPLSDGSGISIMMFGSSRSGKTTLLLDVLLPMFEEFIKIMFLPSYSAAIYNSIRESDAIILEEFTPSIISAAAIFQRTQREKFGADDNRFLVLTDDCTADQIKNNPAIKKGYTVYRNLNISTLCSIQYPMMANKESRANTNFSIYLKQNTAEARKSIVKDHLPDLITQAIPIDVKADAYSQLTEKYVILSDNLNGVIYLLDRSSYVSF